MATGSAPSRANFTSSAFGAWKRKVTLPSVCTSGETMGAGRSGGAAGVCGLLFCATTRRGRNKRKNHSKPEFNFIVASPNRIRFHSKAPVGETTNGGVIYAGAIYGGVI